MCRPPCLSELTLIIFNMELTHFGSEVSIYTIVSICILFYFVCSVFIAGNSALTAVVKMNLMDCCIMPLHCKDLKLFLNHDNKYNKYSLELC